MVGLFVDGGGNRVEGGGGGGDGFLFDCGWIVVFLGDSVGLLGSRGW